MLDDVSEFDKRILRSADKVNAALQRTIASTGMVQMGRSQTLHGRADDWFPLYVDPGEIPAP